MPHALSDSLLPGESLEVGDFLVSNNGLYRLYMEPAGYASLYAYTVDTPVDNLAGLFNARTWLWGIAGGDGSSPGVRLFLPASTEVQLQAADGSVVKTAFNLSNTPNHRFVIQDDGNAVLYGLLPGGSLTSVGSDSYIVASNILPRSYPPNTGTISIKTGQIAVSVSDGDLVNGMNKLIGVRDGSRYVGLHPGASTAVATVAGQLAISSDEYTFLSLHGQPDDANTVPHNPPHSGSGDAVVRRGELSHTVESAGRYQVIVTGAFGLSLSDTRRVVPPAFVPPKHLLSHSHGKSYRPG